MLSRSVLSLFSLIAVSFASRAQMITGTWHGKINKQQVEVKIILNGDYLTGSSYYYTSANNYRRYSIKGYFDQNTNSAVWWDDQLIEEKSGKMSISAPGKIPLLSSADFNCSGGAKMMLDGDVAKKDEVEKIVGDVHLVKSDRRFFDDEWDNVIENYLVGANDPDFIDSVNMIASRKAIPVVSEEKEGIVVIQQKTVERQTQKKPIEQPVTKPVEKPENTETTAINPVKDVAPAKPKIAEKATIVEKFATRTQTFIKEIPVTGDSIELRFYDNAEVDGDSISLFLNGKLLFEHIKLLATPYTIKIAASDLSATNDLVMVAENLGAIPPNTSYMIAMIAGTRYDAYLTSTEGSSALIRFVKKE